MAKHQEKLRLALQKANQTKHHQKRQQQGLLEGNEAQSLFTVSFIFQRFDHSVRFFLI
jgi:hypothetical protein